MPNIDLDDFDARAAIDDLLDRNDDRGGLGRLIPLIALIVLAAAAVVTYRDRDDPARGPARRARRAARARGVGRERGAYRGDAAGARPAVDGGDDLKVIEGIGPRYESVLKAAGIQTFRDLADLRPDRIETILREAGGRMADPSTWPAQARLAADGEWQELTEMQSTAEGRPRGD